MSKKQKSTDSKNPMILKKHIQPLGPRILVRLVADSDRSPSGLYLPQGVKEKHQDACYAKVVEVARDTVATEDIGENVSGVPLGVHVLFPKNLGLSVPWDDQLRIVNTQDVVAIVEEIDMKDAH